MRQCHGAAPTETNASLQFFVALDNIPDVKVETTNSGSMTQEVFMVYAKHFVEALPAGHGPVMLFLDGHLSPEVSHGQLCICVLLNKSYKYLGPAK